VLQLKQPCDKKEDMMKGLANILVLVGVLLLIAAVVGRVVGNPRLLIGLKVMNVVLVANTCLVLALVLKK